MPVLLEFFDAAAAIWNPIGNGLKQWKSFPLPKCKCSKSPCDVPLQSADSCFVGSPLGKHKPSSQQATPLFAKETVQTCSCFNLSIIVH